MIPMFFKSVKKPETKKEAPKAAPDPDEKKADDAKKGGDADDLNYFADLHSLLHEQRGTGEFGDHNVKVGHHVAFKAGSYSGAGKVTASGKDGLHVEDSSKREHRVHWHEVTGHFAKEAKEKGADV